MSQQLLELFDGDLDRDVFDAFEVDGKESGLAVDIETTGLDVFRDTVEVVSIAISSRTAVITIDKTTATLASGKPVGKWLDYKNLSQRSVRYELHTKSVGLPGRPNLLYEGRRSNRRCCQESIVGDAG